MGRNRRNRFRRWACPPSPAPASRISIIAPLDMSLSPGAEASATSPQVRGLPADHRSDIFSLGQVGGRPARKA